MITMFFPFRGEKKNSLEIGIPWYKVRLFEKKIKGSFTLLKNHSSRKKGEEIENPSGRLFSFLFFFFSPLSNSIRQV